MYTVNLKSIATAATLVAHGILTAASDDGSYDYETAATYANNTTEELSYDDEVLVELADCLLYNGECDTLKQYSSVEEQNDRVRTNILHEIDGRLLVGLLSGAL
jgi:hypothetical protein